MSLHEASYEIYQRFDSGAVPQGKAHLTMRTDKNVSLLEQPTEHETSHTFCGRDVIRKDFKSGFLSGDMDVMAVAIVAMQDQGKFCNPCVNSLESGCSPAGMTFHSGPYTRG